MLTVQDFIEQLQEVASQCGPATTIAFQLPGSNKESDVELRVDKIYTVPNVLICFEDNGEVEDLRNQLDKAEGASSNLQQEVDAYEREIGQIIKSAKYESWEAAKILKEFGDL